jgi:multimeric flavodoxin WrbA
MNKKTLIINGSPRPDGNTAALIKEMKKHLNGEIIEISAFRSDISPCVDCRSCWTTARCTVSDDMDIIYQDDFDNVVLASPVYFMTLPGQVLNLMSRMQPWHAAMFFLEKPLEQRPKKAGLILTAGGKGNEEGAMHHVRVLFKMLGANGFEDHIVKSVQTDTIPAESDSKALSEARDLAGWLNED